MPAYDYRCTSCDTTFEVIRRVGQAAHETCPVCDAPAKRVFTPVGVVFKGSGFHNTDYRAKPPEDKPKPSEEPKSTPAPCGADKPTASGCASCPAASD